MYKKQFVSIALTCLVTLSLLFSFWIMNEQGVLSAHAASSIVNYEAESSANTLVGGAKVAAYSACSGGNNVGYIGHGGTLQFNNVQASSSGKASVTIFYVDGDAGRSARLSVNGGTATTITFHGMSNANWNFIQNLTTSVSLKIGSNTINFSNATGWAPNFDRNTVSTNLNATPTPVGANPYGDPNLVSMFDGKTLNGWTSSDPKGWIIENNAMHSTGNARGWIYYKFLCIPSSRI